MSREIEEQREYLNSLSSEDLFIEQVRTSLDRAIDELKFIKFLAAKGEDAVRQELDRLHTTLANTRYMIEYDRP